MGVQDYYPAAPRVIMLDGPQLFEVAVLRKDDKSTNLLWGPKALVATNADNARLQAARELDASVDISQCEVLVRPFV